MSDKMTPIAFSQMVNWVLTEKKEKGTVFGLQRAYQAEKIQARSLFGRKLETTIGPAAGPHTQLAQNIAAAYYGGSRFFELKTVQIIDGEDLPVNKPCIKADDECYNVEWSTELYVPQAMTEYIKAWFLCKIMAKEFGLGDMDGFQFNMSVGYDLKGIQSEKVNTYIDTMMEAKDSEVFMSCKQYLLDHVDLFEHVTKEDIEGISSNICNSATISTLHGCPPDEIERIANHLIHEKGLHTFIKCNPTLLGYEFARKTMDEMGYDYVAFGDFHFLDDLQYKDAIPMFQRLLKLTASKGLEFGVKITNTFPVDVKANELPGEEMYMSGKSLYPLSISLAARLAKEFDGALRISYSGGADFFNISAIVEAGIWPVTMATTMLKPGGYQRLTQIADQLEGKGMVFTGIDVAAVEKIAEDAKKDAHHVKAAKPLPSRKSNQKVPLSDCFMAPCKEEGCPIHQDITTYMKLMGEGRALEALRVIVDKNPLPFITGTICAHRCMSKCNRNFYEEPVQIREMKLKAATEAYTEFRKELKPVSASTSQKAAVIGGGPAGLSAAFFLARGGMQVTIFEKSDSLGGVVKHVIPSFRITNDAIENDIALIKAMGVTVELNKEVTDLAALKAEGYTHVILATGASKAGMLKLEAGQAENALDFLADYKKKEGALSIGTHVVVIGGGNTAMDTARAAKKTTGVEHVYLVYRRTKRYMPADEEELQMAIADGVELKELLSPVKVENGLLTCNCMELSEPDASGRRSVVETGETVTLKADTILAATGEKVDTELFTTNQIAVTDRGLAVLAADTLETSEKQVYVIGDNTKGPATVVEAIRDASLAAEAILKQAVSQNAAQKIEAQVSLEDAQIYKKHGVLAASDRNKSESDRCLNCDVICENCVEVCPNRANVSIQVPGYRMHQVIHVDYMCNECGNCNSFCPYAGAPYQDKFTLFASENDMKNSENEGFAVLDAASRTCRIRLDGAVFEWHPGDGTLPKALADTIETICRSYQWLLVV